MPAIIIFWGQSAIFADTSDHVSKLTFDLCLHSDSTPGSRDRMVFCSGIVFGTDFFVQVVEQL